MQQEAIGLSAITPLGTSSRRLLGHSNENRTISFTEIDVEVMTLCLEPHHWYYVHGVRVHNKGGCFAPWTPVLMSDGKHRTIEKIRTGDRVVSWDMEKGSAAEATVVGIDVFPAPTLLEIVFNA